MTPSETTRIHCKSCSHYNSVQPLQPLPRHAPWAFQTEPCWWPQPWPSHAPPSSNFSKSTKVLFAHCTPTCSRTSRIYYSPFPLCWTPLFHDFPKCKVIVWTLRERQPPTVCLQILSNNFFVQLNFKLCPADSRAHKVTLSRNDTASNSDWNISWIYETCWRLAVERSTLPWSCHFSTTLQWKARRGPDGMCFGVKRGKA